MKRVTWATTCLKALCVYAASDPAQVVQQIPYPNSFGIPSQNATFDYVIVGGGTAGLAMAYHLAADGTNSVVVVEAGGFYQQENGNTSVVPAYNQDYNYITPDSQWDAPLVDWGFLTTPQAGAQGQTFHYGRGKMLGGCSAENAMNYNLPTIGTLQYWADTVDDSSYTWHEFLPYFTQSVNYTSPNTRIRAANATIPSTSTFNVTNGPLQISFPNWAAPLSSWAQLALRELGIKDVNDLISGQLIGSQYNTLTIDPKDQSRSSSQTAYLDCAMAKGATNLHVYTHTMAKQILFDSNKTAYGVVVESRVSPQPFTLSAKQEVILSAGAFQSPQLLMVSGVGPSSILTSHGIPVIADRPGVGQNMEDHVVLSFARQVNVETYGRLMDPAVAFEAEQEYNYNHTGPLTNDMSDYLAFEKLPASYRTNFSTSTTNDLAIFPEDWPEIEYEISSAPFGTGSFSTPDKPIDVAYIQPVMLTAMSRGNITITSANMSDPPVINPNWLTHSTDQEFAIAAFKRGRQLLNATAIQPVVIGDELLPGQDVPWNASDAAILAYMQKNIGFNWHASCTCKMGRPNDSMAVVDSQARVFGVNRLRVVDTSAFPFLPPGHPQATVYGLAAKIAADILRR